MQRLWELHPLYQKPVRGARKPGALTATSVAGAWGGWGQVDGGSAYFSSRTNFPSACNISTQLRCLVGFRLYSKAIRFFSIYIADI